MRKKATRKEKQNKNLLIDKKVFDLYYTEIVIIRKEVCPTLKFENIDQVTFKVILKVLSIKIIRTRLHISNAYLNIYQK